ncbi:small subunit ribosomal protein S6 [Prosthecobacter fusiformis]|uniref:Small ribosomal subunit protein bS6 n=1 Tax=Prosthecobacter fusiformis TaxID=48464 RepID=A0A4R7RPK7_9BACT|nr:30S ribosomal protein S6 [Prosthecobacter fusiformis]TDU66586.1 small subunit ribosomal protein S6 [Prosthecobacter fusiformis]
MKRKYEAMIVLDMKGKEETVEQLVSGIGRDMEKSGAKLEQIDQIGKRKFPYNPRHVESGYFVNFQIEADGPALDSLRAKLKLNDNVYQQYYQRR